MKEKNIAGMKFGRLTAIKFDSKDKKGKLLWLFKCDCGNEKIILKSNVVSGKTLSCGCLHSEIASTTNAKDYTGHKFGKLFILKKLRLNNRWYYTCKCDCGNIKQIPADYIGIIKSCGRCNKSKYYKKSLIGLKFNRLSVLEEKVIPYKDIVLKCRCDCGNIVEVGKQNLIRGNTKSCGCLQKEIVSRKMLIHGLTKTRLYRIFEGMIERCENTHSKNYKNYGLRGITIDISWRNNFINFYNWAMANGYNDSLTIERIDVNGNYCPENCKWILPLEQAKNKTNTIMITYNNETHILADWAKITGYCAQTIRNRLNKYGYNHLEKVITYKTFKNVLE